MIRPFLIFTLTLLASCGSQPANIASKQIIPMKINHWQGDIAQPFIENGTLFSKIISIEHWPFLDARCSNCKGSFNSYFRPKGIEKRFLTTNGSDLLFAIESYRKETHFRGWNFNVTEERKVRACYAKKCDLLSLFQPQSINNCELILTQINVAEVIDNIADSGSYKYQIAAQCH